jgi:hypothetical protein
MEKFLKSIVMLNPDRKMTVDKIQAEAAHDLLVEINKYTWYKHDHTDVNVEIVRFLYAATRVVNLCPDRNMSEDVEHCKVLYDALGELYKTTKYSVGHNIRFQTIFNDHQ